jgi:hypothetical protein
MDWSIYATETAQLAIFVCGVDNNFKIMEK